MKTNEDRLEDLRVNTSEVLRAFADENFSNSELLESKVISICNDFIQLDISILDGGELPGAWGASKLSKSNVGN